VLRSGLLGACLAAAVLWTASFSRAADEDPFALSNSLQVTAAESKPAGADPFDAQNKAQPKAAARSKGATREAAAKYIRFEVEVSPKEVRPGQTVKVTITGTPKPGFHTYSFTKRTPNQEGRGRLVSDLRYQDVPDLKPLWDSLVESEPKLVFEDPIGKILEHAGKFTLSQDILVLPDAGPGPHTLPIRLTLQVCDERGCHAFNNIPLDAVIVVNGEPVPLTAELQKRLQEKRRPETVVVVPDGSAPGTVAGLPVDAGLIGFILSGIFWGAVSLITPCVFPMIPITVSYFLKQSEKEHHKPITMALVYCATIVVVLTIAAVALLSFFRHLSTSPLMNYVIGGLFIFFALSLFGMYEIELPSGLARFTSAREGKGGLVGTMFMALTFTIISFACVAPFLGGFGGTAANSNLTLFHRVLGGLAFALTFASPFFILALFPTLLKKMPKSGSWLNTVKVVMGFLELAAAFKFLRTAELVTFSKPVFLTYDFVLGLYIALSIVCCLYLLNVYRLPHDSPAEHLSVPRMLFGMAFLGLALYLVPALFKSGDKNQSQRPAGVVFAWVDSFLLPEEQESDLPWKGDLEKGLADARSRRKLVFVDFTGYTCTNCKLNERDVFPNVKNLLKRYELVQLYTDKVPDKFYPDSVRSTFGNSATRQQEDAQKNLEFQRKEFNTEELPLYLILEPHETGYKEVGRFGGRIIDQAKFIQFLQRPLETKSATSGKIKPVG
jgi:thiol:disulfide interchange protein DsbD